jgi:hypothetical protein
MKEYATSAKAGFAMTIMGIHWIYSHWGLIWSFITFPKLPKDWNNSEGVRVFTIALMQSRAALELSKIVPVKWSDSMRAKIVTLASNTTVWNFAWEFITSSEPHGDTTPKRLTIRERIKGRREKKQLNWDVVTKPHLEKDSNFELVTIQDEDIEDLITALKVVRLIYNKKETLD